MTPTLWTLIVTYFEAQVAWEAIFDKPQDKDGASPEFIKMDEVQREIIEYRCQSLAEISVKASFLLNDDSTMDRLINCKRNGEPVINFLLRSMIVEEEE
ncbi:hypothetical protein DEM27_05870 [Metarhizobium album]|uniref:Uncharacterized protein n=1 Tax=Metarhizobium album TaxID=2182425 RepID=A0A2U2DV26_9HYPH|nr:hypothetical protein [Rhizobium album]PWE57168.1 hypothetical protein DEM27_05870 [Rhizobium album]